MLTSAPAACNLNPLGKIHRLLRQQLQPRADVSKPVLTCIVEILAASINTGASSSLVFSDCTPLRCHAPSHCGRGGVLLPPVRERARACRPLTLANCAGAGVVRRGAGQVATAWRLRRRRGVRYLGGGAARQGDAAAASVVMRRRCGGDAAARRRCGGDAAAMRRR